MRRLDDDSSIPRRTRLLRREIKARAAASDVPDRAPSSGWFRSWQAGLQGHSTPRSTTPTGIRQAYLTVSGQNSNTRVRVSSDEFLKARPRRTPSGTLTWRDQARQDCEDLKGAGIVWRRSATPPGRRADPGPAVPHPINDWHTVSASGPIIRVRTRARNTCSSTTPPAISPR